MKKRLIILALALMALMMIFINNATAEEASDNWSKYSSNIYTHDVEIWGNYAWEATNRGLVLRSLANPQVYRLYTKENSGLDANQVYALALDEGSGLWLGTDNGLMHLESNRDWTHYNTSNSPLEKGDVRALGLDNMGRLWIGDWGNGLFCLDSEGKWTTFADKSSQFPIDKIHTIASDTEGVWLGTEESGAIYIDNRGNWSMFTPENSGLVGRNVTSIVTDSNGGIWFGTNRGLVHRNSEEQWISYSASDSGLPSNNINCLAIGQDNNVWIATAEGLACLSPDGEITVSEQGEIIKSVAVDKKGNAWTGKWAEKPGQDDVLFGELEELDGIDIPYNVVTDALVDSNGGYWIGTFGQGLAYLADGDDWINYHRDNSILPVNDISSLGIDGDENLWVGTWGGGVVKLLHGEEGSVFNTGNSAIASDTIRALAVDAKDRVWIATPLGVAYYHAGSWHNVELKGDLTGNDIRDISCDNLGNIWFETRTGDVVVYNQSGVATDLRESIYSTDIREIAIFYNDRRVSTDVAPVMEGGRTLLPMRVIFEALGAEVDWNGELRRVNATLGDLSVELTVDEAIASVNGVEREMDVPARVEGGRTLVPLRFVGESLGLDVEWDGTLRSVILKGE
ncbi:ligand-binding sensor domain-containing protein [Desulfitispora alkaliphila]|uniref:stalk domain-containing protein n=1 Tax=Desulfitispora alkaliphila TaxID=622674 RepID=UPI003D1A50B9